MYLFINPDDNYRLYRVRYIDGPPALGFLDIIQYIRSPHCAFFSCRITGKVHVPPLKQNDRYHSKRFLPDRCFGLIGFEVVDDQINFGISGLDHMLWWILSLPSDQVAMSGCKCTPAQINICWSTSYAEKESCSLTFHQEGLGLQRGRRRVHHPFAAECHHLHLEQFHRRRNDV